jgi:predicted nucleic acid-binding protein
MIVVSDTSPINYLVQIDAIHILSALFGQVTIPIAVHSELLAPNSPDSVRRWLWEPSAWLRIETASDSCLDVVDKRLDAGERQAIAFAIDRKAGLLIIDERAGRLESKRLNLNVTGTLGVLVLAAHRGLIDLPTAIERLKETNCYLSAALISRVLRGAL